MGAGVYSSDFDRAGSTFIVKTPFFGADEYEAYLEDRAHDFPDILFYRTEDGLWNWRQKNVVPSPEDFAEGRFDTRNDALVNCASVRGDFIPDFDAWSQQEYDNFNRFLVDQIEDAGRAMGLAIVGRSREELVGDSRFVADRNFACVIDDPAIEVGWCDWEGDFVVGTTVGAGYQEILSDINRGNADSRMILEKTGMTASDAGGLLARLQSNVEEFIRLSMMGNGIVCAYRTSGYTTSRYELPDDAQAKMQALADSIRRDRDALIRPVEERIISLSDSDRLALARGLHALHEDEGYGEHLRWEVPLLVPMVDLDTGALSLWSPYVEGCIKERLLDEPTRALVAELDKEQDEAFFALPRIAETEAIFQALQEEASRAYRPFGLVVDAASFVEAIKEDLILRYLDEDGVSKEMKVMTHTSGPRISRGLAR